MAQRLNESSIAGYAKKARKYLFRKLKSDKSRKIVNKNERNRLNDSFLKAAAEGRTKRVERLLRLGANVNARDGIRNMTALMWAAHHGHMETCALLIENGADIAAKDIPFGNTAFMLAKSFGGNKMLQQLRLATLLGNNYKAFFSNFKACLQ